MRFAAPSGRYMYARCSMALTHWELPPAEKKVWREPKSSVVFSSLSRMTPSGQARSSAPGTSVMSSASQPSSPRPLCPGIWSRSATVSQ